MMHMSNTVNFKLDDDLYFRLLALRVKLKAKGGWKGFVERVLDDYENGTLSVEKKGEKTGKGAELPKLKEHEIKAALERAKELDRCATCGHDRSEHNAEGTECHGDDDACECKRFTVAAV